MSQHQPMKDSQATSFTGGRWHLHLWHIHREVRKHTGRGSSASAPRSAPPRPRQLCDRLLPGPQAPGLRPQSPLRLCPGLLSPRQVGRGMHLLGHTRGKVGSGPGFRWPPGNWPETGVPFTSAGKDTEAGDLETEAGHWPSKAGHWPLPLMPLAPVLDATLPPSAPLPGTLGLGPSLQIHHRPRPAPSGRAGWQVFWSASGQSASRSRRAPCAQWQSPLRCGLPGASESGASSASIVSPDAMCCLAASQQMPRRALSCCPAGDGTDSALCPPGAFSGSCGAQGTPRGSGRAPHAPAPQTGASLLSHGLGGS